MAEENREIARINFHIDELRKSEIRKDIELELRSEGPAGGPGSEIAGPLYVRTGRNRGSFTRARDLLAKRDYRGALALFENVVNLDPKDYEAWTDLGTAQSLDKKQKEAETSFRRALEANPPFLVAQLNLGKLYLSKQEPDKAVEILAKAVETSPASADANFYLGEAYLQIKRGSKGGRISQAGDSA